MDWRWIVRDDGRLVLSNNAEEYCPNATFIFSALKGDKTILPEGSHTCSSPKTDLPNIRFSSLGIPLRLSVGFDGRDIFLSCCAEKRGHTLDITGSVSGTPDSIVIGSTWVYFAEARDEIVSLLQDAEIDSFGKISLSEYISLSRALLNYPNINISDTAREALSNHPTEAVEPVEVNANLYPYQKQGFQWLRFVTGCGCGCILGDEMGLGKTLQVITLIVSRMREVRTPALIIAPVSLLENWRREFERFTTGVCVLIHHGTHRTGFYTEFLKYDVVVISYNTAVSDLSILNMVKWSLLVLDEAQNIKNPNAIRSRSVKRINHNAAVAITGTPFENHMTDLWSLVDFIAPGRLGTQTDFSHTFPDDITGASKLEPILTPLMLRRKVSDVAQDLPERTDIPQALCLTDHEATLYEEERRRILNEHGEKAALPMLQKLRMFCTHPALIDNTLPADPCVHSTKYQRLCEILEEISVLGEKAILFTSYNTMFDILSKDIPERLGIPVSAINGATPPTDRQRIIDNFSALAGTALLVLNPKAAGTGLNITAASRVIHYNLEWNPALEDQSSARAYRRGQKRHVFVYRLFYADTVEEIINERIEKKRAMFDTAVMGVDGTSENREDIIQALMISPVRGND